MVLSNISRPEPLVESIVASVQSQIRELVSAFTQIEFNQKKCHLNYLGRCEGHASPKPIWLIFTFSDAAPIFSNLAQKTTGRDLFCQKGAELLQRILPFVHLSEEGSIIRKGGAIGLLKNICFDSSRHDFLLEDLNVLPFILLPLAGPEDFDEEDMDKFPIELQYLGGDKKRESDPDLRKMLLESLAQLCATRKSRDFLRTNGVYEILRELHKWENTDDGDKLALLACEKVVDILIRWVNAFATISFDVIVGIYDGIVFLCKFRRTEEEIGEDNLKNLDIPTDVIEKIEKMEDWETHTHEIF